MTEHFGSDYARCQVVLGVELGVAEHSATFHFDWIFMSVDDFCWEESIFHYADASICPQFAGCIVEWLGFDNVGYAFYVVEHRFDLAHRFAVCGHHEVFKDPVVTSADFGCVLDEGG